MAPNNSLPVWGNEKTMNLNTLILTNIQSSPYFKVNLFDLKTYHEVIDEIYYKVSHLEPWEKGSRKTAGQTGMCGGVRGVGAGGIVSSAYCLLFKLFTLKLTKKQLVGLITHSDSPYIRGLGFMYIRYTQPPADLWDWYEEYLNDEEEIDVKAGGGHSLTMGELCRQFLVKLEWYSTLFPRIPVPVQKTLREKLSENPPVRPAAMMEEEEDERERERPRKEDVSFGEAERIMSRRRSPQRRRSRSPRRPSPRRSPHRRSPPTSSRSPSRYDREKDRHRERRGGGERGERERTDDFSRVLEREKERQRREKTHHGRDRDHDRERKKDRRSHSRDKKQRSHSTERQVDRHRSRHSDEERPRKRSRSRERKEKSSKSKEHKRSKERKRSRSREHKSSKEKSHVKRSRANAEYKKDSANEWSPQSRNGDS